MNTTQLPEGPFDKVSVEKQDDGTYDIVAVKDQVRVVEGPVEDSARAEEIAQQYREGRRGVNFSPGHVTITGQHN